MDINYILTNTFIYGTLALVLQLFFAYHKFRNMLIGSVCMTVGYVLIYWLKSGFDTRIIIVGIFCLLLRFGTVFLINKFSDEKKEGFGLLWTIGGSLFLGNLTNYIFGPSAVSLESDGIGLGGIICIILGINIVLRYLFHCARIGKVFVGIAENTKIIKSLGVKIKNYLTITTIISILLLALISYIILTTNTIKVSDDMFYLIKGTGIMILVGLDKSKRIYVGALVYVIAEYLLFITRGLPIGYKETLILVLILLVLFFKPKGLFNRKQRAL